MIDLKINDETLKIPSSFDDITLGDYCRIYNGIDVTDKNDAEIRKIESIIISKLLNKPDDYCLSLPLPVYALIRENTSFIFTHPNKEATKHSIEVDNIKYYPTPADKLSVRQWIDIDYFSKSKDADSYVNILSAILLPRNGEYKGEDKLKTEKLSNIRASVALPLIYNFFYKGKDWKILTQTYINPQAIL